MINTTDLFSRIRRYSFVIPLLLFSVQSWAGFWTNRWEELASPFTTEANMVLLGGSALTGILVIDGVEDSLGQSVQKETVEEKPLGSFSKVGDISGQMVPNIIYIGAFYGMAAYYGNEAFSKKAEHMFKSTFYAAGTTTVLKYVARERRPDSNNRDAFPSGHSTTAFAFAAVVGTEHEWYWALPAYGLATLVAYSRINDNKHQLHDVVGGAFIGLTYGLSIHYLQEFRDKKGNAHQFGVAPYADGLTASYRLSF
jgi:hypothetical protein